MAEVGKYYLFLWLFCVALVTPGVVKAECVVYNTDSDQGLIQMQSALEMPGAGLYRHVPDNWIPRDEHGKPFPGEFKMVCREVEAYVMPEPVHCVAWNNDTADVMCQYGDSWKNATGQWTAHGEWEEYGDPCGSYNEAIKRGESMPNEPSCTGLESPRPVNIPRDGTEISA